MTVLKVFYKLIVIKIDNSVDYRFRTLNEIEVYYDANDLNVNKKLFILFSKISSSNEIKKNGFIVILNRNINFIFLSGEIIWFNFYQLCSSPRSQNDYIELAKIYHTVFITNIPIFSTISDDEIRRFIALIDEFYDCNVKIIISSFVEIYNLYDNSKQLNFEFKRTLSRLVEMKSSSYLLKKHHMK